MRSIFFVFLLCVLSISIAQSQTSAIANTGGTGWKRIAHITDLRGFGTISLYVAGGSYRPVMTTIDWFHDWSDKGGISIQSNTQDSPYWSAARIIDDGTYTYIEVFFTSDITSLRLLSDDYGWNAATLYSGTLPAGGDGVARATATRARFNIENKFMVAYNGNVGIGTASPQAKLAVEGNILAKEIQVKTDISVPDYVFEPDYDLRTLAETETYIKKHKHLPEIPSAAEVQRDGLDLAEMNLLLLKKVEELTLHLIEKDKTEQQLLKTVQTLTETTKALQSDITLLKAAKRK